MKISRILIPFAIAILSLPLVPATTAGQLDIWTWRNPVPTPNQLYGVTHGIINGNTLWVAVGANSTILTSSDGGMTWALQVAPSPLATLSGVVYGNVESLNEPLFVAVGSSDNNGTDVILTSLDGTNWVVNTQTSLWAGTVDLFAVAYGDGIFMAVGFDGYNYYSSDGMNWTQASSLINGGTGDANGVAYGLIGPYSNPGFVAVGDDGVSTNLVINMELGNNWMQPSSAPSYGFSGVTYDSTSHEFVAVGDYGFLNSPDGVNWYSTANTYYANAVVYMGGIYGLNQFVAVNDSSPPSIYTSPGGNTSGVDTWTAYTGSYPFDAIDWDDVNGNFVAVGPDGTIATSYNGTSWIPQSKAVTLNSLNAVTYAENLFVTVGAKGTILTSPDGITWNPVSPSVTLDSLNAITYGVTAEGENLFMAGGTNSINGGPGIFTSPDGDNTWTLDSDPSLQNSALTDGYVNGLAHGAMPINSISTPEFVALVNITANRSNLFANGSEIISSTNGLTWSEDYQIGVFNVLNGIAYGMNAASQPVFVAVGDYGTAVCSTDLHTWTLGSGLPLSFDSYFNAVAYGNSMFVAVGYDDAVFPPEGVIYSSPDGANWSPVPLPTTPSPFSGVTCANGVFVATTLENDYGADGNIWVSTNAVNWTQTSTVASGSLNAVAEGDYQYIAVGSGGAILGSVLDAIAGGSYTPPSGGSSGSFSFTAYGPSGKEYGVYVSNNLVTWTWLENITIPGSSTKMTVTASTSMSYTQGYYYLGPPGP
jgi:hypothetical protein